MVTVISNGFGYEPAINVKRYSSAQKKIVNVKCPNAIVQYNKNMGGTDRMDEDVNHYRIEIRSKKWYWPILTWLFDVSMNNAWIQYKNAGHQISNLEFRRSVVGEYLTNFGTAKKTSGRESREINPRFDGSGHLIQMIPNKKRRRCAGSLCNSIVSTFCPKCNVGLCIKCFFNYHTK
jgi:hypothetical protein